MEYFQEKKQACVNAKKLHQLIFFVQSENPIFRVII